MDSVATSAASLLLAGSGTWLARIVPASTDCPSSTMSCQSGGRRIFICQDFGVGYLNAAAFFILGDFGNAVDFGDQSLSFGRPGFKQLFYPGQTGGDIQTDDTAGMEGTQGQLGTGFTDTLGGDDADGGIGFYQLAAGQVSAVAHLADAPAGLAGQR